MMMTYDDWIADHVPEYPVGLCREVTEAMVAQFPELRRVRGHYGPFPHWWCETPEGVIVDPTIAQFPTGCYVHVEHHGAEPVGKCMNCGGYVFAPRSNSCSDACDSALDAYYNGALIPMSDSKS